MQFAYNTVRRSGKAGNGICHTGHCCQLCSCPRLEWQLQRLLKRVLAPGQLVTLLKKQKAPGGNYQRALESL